MQARREKRLFFRPSRFAFASGLGEVAAADRDRSRRVRFRAVKKHAITKALTRSTR